MITGKLRLRIVIFSLATLFFYFFLAGNARADEALWRKKQKDVIEVVQRLTRIGTRYPAFRCGLYVPGHGVCYMKMTTVKCESGDKNVSQPYVADVAEVIEVSTDVGKKKILDKKEHLFMQSRFFNTTYLRLLTADLVDDISVTPQKNLMALKKLLEDIVTYIGGSYKDKKTDTWISVATERFAQGALPVYQITGEGMIIPDKAIVLYQKYPGIYQKGGEKALADKLFDAFRQSKALGKYYGKYDLVIGAESGPQLLYASYAIKDVGNIKREELKYYRYADSGKSVKKSKP